MNSQEVEGTLKWMNVKVIGLYIYIYWNGHVLSTCFLLRLLSFNLFFLINKWKAIDVQFD